MPLGMAGKAGTTPTTYSPSPTTGKKKPPLFKEDSTRPDYRNFHRCRPAFFRTAAVNAASGSANAEFGNTMVIVSVFGPRVSKKAMMYSDTGRLNYNVSYTTFATPVRGQGSDHKEYSSMLHKALEGAIILESFPKINTVDVFALVLQSSGSDLPVVISCASLALADAGILMYDLVASVAVEENSQGGSVMTTCMPSRYEITQLTVIGEWSTPKINEGMQLCLDACAKLAKITRSCVKESSSDAGILMYNLVASVSVSCLGKNLVIDPISEEENSQYGSLMITCTPSRYEITQLTVTGEWSTPKINEGMQLCLGASAKLVYWGMVYPKD